MLPRLWSRPEPDLDRQPLALEHLRDMGRAVPKSVLSHDAYGAFLVLAASRVRIADCYTHALPDPRHKDQRIVEWVLELHGAEPWQECRFSPEQFQAFYDIHLAERYKAGTLDGAWWLEVTRHLANEYPNGALASTVDNVVQAARRVRGEVVA